MRNSLNRSIGRLALGLSTVTVLTGATAFEASAAALTPLPSAGQSAEETASAQAAAQGKPVPVPSLTDEASTTVANPDGSFTATITSGPSQVQRDGQWVPIDTSLAEDGAVLRPRASRAKVEVSNGGEGTLAKMTDDNGRVFSIKWPTALPKPVVKDNVATFTDAAGPGADLVVTVLPTGFRHDVVLRERPTGPLELRIPVQTDGVELSESAEGRLLLTSTAGDDKVVAAAPQPVMWDSKGHGKPRGDSLSKIDTAVETQNGTKVLVLKPDAKFLADPARVYPVTVDPVITLPGVTDTDVATSWAAHPGDPMIIAGTMPWENGQGGDIMRSLVKFDTRKLTGKRVIFANMAMWNLETNACGLRVGSGLTAQRITSAWDETDLNWDNKPTTTEEGQVTNRMGRGRTWTAPCPGGAGYLSWPITKMAKAWASGAANYGVQLKGADEKEATNWRAFAASENKDEGVKPPTLTVIYWR
ncbi:DNRLRE domain-containing protein [Nonomuraea sp. NPDC005983]|uniref:DNRLRE domain-containing protein n=1 Tax=Nonomuraea sp. NPDC005983 TaxID=3155595 RepID=UPI0033B83EBE